MCLTICIPTFNRSAKLDNQLRRLLTLIRSSPFPNYVSVHVSDNGSTDDTQLILAKHRQTFSEAAIKFSTFSFERNFGFDHNIYSCYSLIATTYIWFLSDDDIIHPNCLSQVLLDIQNFPNVIFYNFMQPPFTLSNPYLVDQLYATINQNDIEPIVKIASWPKLSALVIKKLPINSSFLTLNLPFAHVALSIYLSITYGHLLFSSFFIASVDIDYLDTIDFPPYVGNAMDTMIESLFDHIKHNQLKELDVVKNLHPKVSLFDTSLDYLTMVNIASVTISSSLKCELTRNIREHIAISPYKIFKLSFINYILSFLFRYYPLLLLANLRKTRRFSRNSSLLLSFLLS